MRVIGRGRVGPFLFIFIVVLPLHNFSRISRISSSAPLGSLSSSLNEERRRSTRELELFELELRSRRPSKPQIRGPQPIIDVNHHNDHNSTLVFYSRQRSTGCKCGKKPFADNLFPIFNFHYKGDQQFDEEDGADLVRPLIVGGEPAELYEFPWMVAIADISLPRQKIVCGGALINSNYVLTAAHCISHRFLSWTEVWFNAHDIDKVRTDENVLTRKVKQFILHPKYPQWNREHDIALIELKDPIDFTRSSIRPVCLPTSNTNDYAGDQGTVAGFGYNASHSGVRTSTLHKVSVPILSHKACLKTEHFNTIQPTMLCAGKISSGGKDACYSDSGGPLMVENGSRNTIVGIVAWGRGCGRKNLPGVYTRVSSYLKWIHGVVRKGEWCQRKNNKFLQQFQL